MNKIKLAAGIMLAMAFTMSCSLDDDSGGISGSIVGEGGSDDKASAGERSDALALSDPSDYGGNKLPPPDDDYIRPEPAYGGGDCVKPPWSDEYDPSCQEGRSSNSGGGDYIKPPYEEPSSNSGYVPPVTLSLNGTWQKPSFTLVIDESDGTLEVNGPDGSFSVRGVITSKDSYGHYGSFSSDEITFEYKLDQNFLFIMATGEFEVLNGDWRKE